MSLTKSDIANRISDRCGCSKNRSSMLIDSILEIFKKTLESGEDVLISGLGKFCVSEKDARRGRNVISGDELTLGSRRVVTFRCSPVLRGKLNGNRLKKRQPGVGSGYFSS